MVKDGAMEGDVPGPGWAAPGAPAEPDGPGSSRVPGTWPPVDDGEPAASGRARLVSATGVLGGADRPEGVPQVALRPMTLADILDGGFSIIKARPRRILTLTAALVIPVQIVAAVSSRDLGGGLFSSDVWVNDQTSTTGDTTTSSLNTLGLIAALILPSIALVCIAAAIAHLVMGWSVGHDASGREMIGAVGHSWWPLLATFVIVHLAEIAGGFLCYLGAFAVMALFVVVAPVIGAEKASTGEALRRSIALVRPRFWPVLGTAVLMGIVSATLGNVLSFLPQGIVLAIGMESGWPVAALGSIIGQVVTTPFVAAATTLLYLDLRVRTEGIDIELAARRAIDRVA